MKTTELRREALPPIVGPDGAATLGLALAAIAASGGLTLLAALAWTAWEGWTAPTAPHRPAEGARILVLGRRLPADGRPGTEFRARLARAAALHAALSGAEIVILGGAPAPDRPTEADAGRAWLIAHGVPAAAIRTETRSRHTLENLRCYRATFPVASGPLLLVTSRTHLPRSRRMAAELGLDCLGCAAETQRSAALRPLRPLHEAFLLHWYVIGSRYAALTRNARMLARIR
jgi:uncharacterized SAM-binding protein YcdF (DUF218 family)